MDLTGGILNLEGFESKKDDDFLESAIDGSDLSQPIEEKGKCSDKCDKKATKILKKKPEMSMKELEEKCGGAITEAALDKVYQEMFGESFDESEFEESGDVNIPVPGGLSEKPSGQPADHSISIPSGTEITQDVYNSALANLQKSFKEGAELLEQLQHMTVVQESVEQRQQSYIEAAMDEALLAAYENGPVFEAVSRSDKHDVKKIVSEIRSNIAKDLDDAKISFYKPQYVAKIIATAIGAVSGAVKGGSAGGPAGAVAGAISGGIGMAASQFAREFSVRLWQVIGVCHVEEGNIKDIADGLTEKYKDKLGSDYKILYVTTVPSFGDLLKTKFGWKNAKKTYFLLVDKSIPKELKEFQKEVDDAVKNADKDNSGSKDGENKKD